MFGFAYGGEVPQIPTIIGKYFGLKSVGALVGLVVFGAMIGGAIGAWFAGRIFDMTQSYQLAFSIAIGLGIIDGLIVIYFNRTRPLV